MKITRFTNRILSYLLVFGLLSMVACKKKDIEPNDGVQGDWQITSVKFDPVYTTNGIAISDFLAIYALQGNDCPTKTTFSFKADGSVDVTAPTTCEATKNDLMSLVGIESGTTWKNENDMLILTTNGNALGAGLAVDKSTMTLNDEATLDDGISHKIAVSFKRL